MKTCNAAQAKCLCGIDEDICDGRHLCGDPTCGGSWRDGGGADITVFMIPFRLSWIRQAAATYEIMDMTDDWDKRRDLVHGWQMKLDY